MNDILTALLNIYIFFHICVYHLLSASRAFRSGFFSLVCIMCSFRFPWSHTSINRGFCLYSNFHNFYIIFDQNFVKSIQVTLNHKWRQIYVKLQIKPLTNFSCWCWALNWKCNQIFQLMSLHKTKLIAGKM